MSRPTFLPWSDMWVLVIKTPTLWCGRYGLPYEVSLFPAPHHAESARGLTLARALTGSADVEKRRKGAEEGPHEDSASGTATPEYSASETGSDSAPRERHECVICGITTTSAAHLEVNTPFSWPPQTQSSRTTLRHNPYVQVRSSTKCLVLAYCPDLLWLLIIWLISLTISTQGRAAGLVMLCLMRGGACVQQYQR